METLTKPFMNGRSQAVRIPANYRFDMNDDLYINKVGDSLIITPKKALKSAFMKGISMVTDDFLAEGRPEETPNDNRNGDFQL